MTTAEQTQAIIRRHTVLSAAAGGVPVPGVDMAASAAVQVRMIRELAEAHGTDFDSARARAVTLAAISAAAGFSHGIPKWAVMRFPILTPVGFVLKPLYVAALTWGLGSTLDLHFSRGGKLSDFNPLPQDIRGSMQRGLKTARGWIWAADREPAVAAAEPAAPASTSPVAPA